MEGGIDSWLYVTCLKGLVDEDATCTNLLLWGQISSISVSREEEKKG